MQRLAASNFRASFTGNAQRRIVGGKTFLVAPVSMIVPGVLAGSKGPLHYPQEMVARNAGRWSGIPLTLGHPSDPITSSPQSASEPGVVSRLGLGFVKNDRFEAGKHRAEAWFDEDQVRKKAPQLLAALNSGNLIEVSTGLFTDEREQRGTWNGREYDRVVTGYEPDHLAILTDQRGACSVSDGCGVHNAAVPAANAATNNGGSMPAKTVQNDDDGYDDDEPTDNDDVPDPVDTGSPGTPGETGTPDEEPTGNDACPCGGECKSCKAKTNNRDIPQSKRDEMPKKDFAGPHESFPIVTQEDVDSAARLIGHADDPEAVKARIKSIAKKRGLKVPDAWTTENTITEPLADQPRCPIKQTYQPKGFKGTGKGEVHTAAKAGFADTKIVNPDSYLDDMGDNVQKISPDRDDETTVAGENFQGGTPPGIASNSNPEGINQYTKGGGSDKEKEVTDVREEDNSGFHAIPSKAREASKAAAGIVGYKSSTAARHESTKANASSFIADKGGRAGHKAAARDHAAAADAHQAAQDKALKEGNLDRFMTHYDAQRAHREAADFHKGRAKEYVHNNDRSSSNGQTREEFDMNRQQMIQHLTTNCPPYKGKLAVLNAMTDEMLSELIVNAQFVAEARKLIPGGAEMTVNAMPAALKKAMDKKKEGPDDDEDDDEVTDNLPGTTGTPMPRPRPTGNMSTEQWLSTAPKAVRQIVQNQLARDRAAKQRLIDQLTANVGDEAQREVLANHYLKLPVETLEAQVAAMPQVQNESFDFLELDQPLAQQPTANYEGAAMSGHDRGPAIISNGRGEATFEGEPLSY